jgi:hypothetical protein
VIPAVHPRGTDVGGLLRYLFGPGKREEHVRPRVVAAWDGAGPLDQLQPPARPGGWHDVRALTELLEQPVIAARNPPRKTVWHCSIRNHPTDRVLSDELWGRIGAQVIAAVGLAPHGDGQAVRWVAVRHNADHIHLVATLVRQDRRTVWPWQDKRKAQAACRDLEDRYGLHRVAGHGTRRWPSPAELNKTARLHPTGGERAWQPGPRTGHAAGRTPPRDRLRRRVREVAAVATDEADFFARLATAGVLVRRRHSTRNPGQVTGYAVGLPEHRTAAGDTVWYGGGRLGSDLTLPRLRSRWTETGSPTPPRPAGGPAARLAATGEIPPHAARNVAGNAARMVRQATAAMGAAPSPAVASQVAEAAADLLTATAQVWEGDTGGPLTDATEWLDRAAHHLRDPRERGPSRRTSHAGHLRAMARLIALMGNFSRDQEDTITALHLIYALTALAEALADLSEARHRRHAGAAARRAAEQLRAWTPPAGTSGSHAPSARPTQHAPDTPTRSRSPAPATGVPAPDGLPTRSVAGAHRRGG